MPSTGITVNATAQNLVSELSLGDGESYELQNESPNEVLFAELATAPADTFLYWKRLGEKQRLQLDVDVSLGAWVKTRNPADIAYLSVNDAV